MVALALLFAGGISVACAGPRILKVLLRRFDTEPRLLLRIWLTLTVTSVAATIGSLVLSIVPGHGGLTAFMSVVHLCWSVMHDSVPWGLEAIVGTAATAALIVGTVRFVTAWRRAKRTGAVVHDRHLALKHITHDPQANNAALWLPVDAPVAYSTSGQPGLVVISRGVEQRLDRQALDAVLAHEEAHVSRRHHRTVRFAEALAHAFPWLPIARCSPVAVRVLVEFDADHVAAEAHGRTTVARALRSLHGGTPTILGALGMSDGATELRLARLSVEGATTARTRLGGMYGVAATTAAVAAPAVPLLAAALALMLATCVN